ncbi:unnamed protein product [Sphagnum jensenii]|uniref:Metallothionein n=1 Tax=Sphagnum jensenii TaxID=128206 RepID=A0ABP0WS15_9BRYO
MSCGNGCGCCPKCGCRATCTCNQNSTWFETSFETSFSTVASETAGNCGNYRSSCPPGTYAKDGGENHELFFPVAEEEEEDTGGNCSNCGNNKWVLQ